MKRNFDIIAVVTNANTGQTSPSPRLTDQMTLSERTTRLAKGEIQSAVDLDGFHGTELARLLRERSIRRVAVAGVATEGAVRASILGGIREGFETWLLVDAVGGCEQRPGEIDRALVEMRYAGANFAAAGQMATLLTHQRHPSALVIVDLLATSADSIEPAPPAVARFLQPFVSQFR